MKKIFALLMMVVLVCSVIVTASMLIPSSDRAKEVAKAPDKSPVITLTESGEWELDRIDYVHYAKPDWAVKPPKPPKTESCYKLMGVKWKAFPVSYVVNPTNLDGLSDEFVLSTIQTAAETWDSATVTELFDNNVGVDYTAQYGVQNYVNAIEFADYPEDGVIGVTSVWYTRKGKQIVEFDMILDTDFTWGDATANPLVMDLENIAVHELGHSVGLSDLYSDACSAVTMYGYSTEGEVSKRTLEQSDINGLQSMYG